VEFEIGKYINNEPDRIKLVKAVKNQYKSNLLNVHKINANRDSDDNNYLVYANGGCLATEMVNGIIKNEIRRCNIEDTKQHFIFGPQTDNSNLINYKLSTPTPESTHCITFSHSGLSVRPCEKNTKGQNFSPLYNHI
jgi:hypothetical protein